MSWKDALLAVSSWCRRKTITHVACGGILDGRPVGAAVWGLSRAGELLSESCVFVTQISSSAMDVAWGRSCGFGARQAWGAVQTCIWLTLPTIDEKALKLPINTPTSSSRHARNVAINRGNGALRFLQMHGYGLDGA